MPKYNIYTKIESNVSAVDLFYDLNVYRTDASNKKHILLSVAQQPVTSNYQTQSHETNDTEDGLNKIEHQILSRMNRSSYPNQGDTSLCGPASFFYCLLMDRPDIYKQAVNELWLYGKTKIGALNIVPSNSCRHPMGAFYDAYGERVKGIDWITLASLRDSENSIMSYDEIDDQASGITLWGALTEWFVSAGYQKEFSNVGLSHVNLKELSTLNEYIRKGCRVVTLISAGILDGFDSAVTAKNHWIVWDGPITTQYGEVISLTTKENELVQLKLFSWGKVKNQIKRHLALSDVMGSIFGGVVFKSLE